jgi:hypothetical protein
METMTAAERRWIWVYGLALACLCSLPYVLAFSKEGSTWVFTGFVFGVEDGNSYIAKMLSGSHGAWLFQTPYTTMLQRGELIFLPYLLLGKLAAQPELHLQLVVLFHLFRFLATPFTVFAVYRFSSLYFTDASWRRWVTILATIGGGLGWLLPLFGRNDLLGSLPLDFISPETFGFLALLGLPHLILARGLLIMAVHAYLKDGLTEAASWRSGLLLFCLTLVQSLSTLTAYAVICAHLLIVLLSTLSKKSRDWQQTWLPAALRSILPSLPLILYYIFRFSTDPFLQAWTAQNQILSPHPLHYVIAYGLIFVLALVAIIQKPWQEQPLWLFPAAWMLALPFLAYFPHNLQRRLVEAGWIALLLLAARALQSWRQQPRLSSVVRYTIAATAIVSPIMLFAGSLQVASRPTQPAFMPRRQVRGFEWLAETAPEGSIVLASYATSNALPAWAPMRVPIGHGPESVGLDDLKPQVEAIYGNALNEQGRRAWLLRNEVDYLIYSETERALGEWTPDLSDYLTEVYRSEAMAIYEVQHAQD